MVQDGQRGTTTMADRAAEAQRATWVSVVVNLLLTVAQLVVGWLAHSQSLVAHGLHSFSDLLSDFLNWAGKLWPLLTILDEAPTRIDRKSVV